MNWLRSFVTITLLALWLPATSLCLLERTGWLSSDDCCPSNTQRSSDKSSGETPCCVLASATYKADNYQSLEVAAPIAALLSDWSCPPLIESLALSATPSPSLSPPELPASWQFNYRTALPPRAPSFVS